MPSMSTPRELFVHELGDLLYAEKKLVKTLPKLASEASDEELRAGFESHLDQTKGHVDRLEEVFAALGEKPKAEKCPGIDGIVEEHDEFMSEESPGPEICDMFLTGAGARAEHYEIARYGALRTWAQQLGLSDAVKLLDQTLAEEKATDKKLTELAINQENVKAAA